MRCFAGRAAALLLGTIGSVHAGMSQVHARSKPADEPVGLEIAYAMSFADYDACGDVEAGTALRRAILEKVRACPYSPEAREMFNENVRLNIDRALSSILQKDSEGQSFKPILPPELKEGSANPDGSPMTCNDYRHTARYLERRTRLLRYAHGEISASDALEEAGCPSGPASL